MELLAHSPSCLKSSVKFPQSVMFGVQCHLLVLVQLCFLKTNVYQEILEHLMLPSADQLFKDADFIFPLDLAPAHTAKSTKSWLNNQDGGVLDSPAKSPDLNPHRESMGYCKKENKKRDQKMQMSLRPLSKKPGLPYHLSSATN